MSVSFCSPESPSSPQPSTHLEQFQTLHYFPPTLNFTWSPHPLLCSKQVLEYNVDVTSNSRIINAALKAFGGFPQNTCEPSKANEAMLCEGRPCNACSEPWEEGCSSKILHSDFKVTKSMVRAASLFNFKFTVKAYGKIESVDEEVTFWCMEFASGEDGRFVIDTDQKFIEGEYEEL
ncbi:hypothetical protein TrST_g8742 [Triparma strigata]|uniref:Uncharacterized protein n=1 Tax=Triparma strigata TaxID=1606541 RepID=A0A9W6ZYP5_9STRA|nr:hypothetical protein TrST_g8742 [Triparma strigata]